MSTDWQPANDVEHALTKALDEGDIQHYVQTLMAAVLYCPVLPERGTPEWELFEQTLPFDPEPVLAFTSPEALHTVLGNVVRDHRQTTLEALRPARPEPHEMLAVNPGLPIGAALPFHNVDQLIEEQHTVIPTDDIQAAMSEHLAALIRYRCMAELSGTEPVGIEQLTRDALPKADAHSEPENELEEALAEAAEAGDMGTFLWVLSSSDVVVPITGSLSDVDDVEDDELPWRVISCGSLQAIPMFTSEAELRRVAPDGVDHAQVPFIEILAAWPGEEFLLCLNPGSQTELVLPGEGMLELISTVQDALESAMQEGQLAALSETIRQASP
ncbi:SseB family protein [Saccharomonospora sp. NPDC046836]|uniref:SseB family protein n=1 Tax=Saccharomonospora sp. NPDC046836 TaxID=3156921 RepID=UPI0033EAFC8A